MKLKITRPDGTIVEAEGTVEECERLAAATHPVQFQYPIYLQFPYIQPVPLPVYPTYPSYPSPYYVGDPIGVTPTWGVIQGATVDGISFTYTEPAPLRM